MSPMPPDLLTSQRLLSLLPWVFLIGGLGLLAVLLWQAIPRRPRRVGAGAFLRGDEEATAAMDFVLVLPFFAIIILTIVQLALLVNAKLVVGYAAYAAARSAAVWIPATAGAEASNTIGQQGSDKWTRILSAARIGCLPIASSQAPFGLGSGGGAGDVVGGAVGVMTSPLFVHHTNNFGSRVVRAGRKWLWSRAFTDVKITGADNSGKAFGPTEMIEVTVSHRFYMNVTLAGQILQRLLAKDATDRALDTVTVSESYAMVSQGKLAGM